MTADTPSHLVPKLRFPEFRDTPGWSKRALGEILRPIVREREKPAVPYTGLGIRSHGRGTFRKELEHPEKTLMDRLYEVDCDDLIVNITFAWEGAIAIVRSEDAGALVSHRFPTYQFDQNAVLTDFFRYPIIDKQFIYNLGVISPGGAGRNRVLNKADFLKIELALPEVAEQQKIADCLGSLDDLIATKGRKLEALQLHKQALVQQLFPQPGETVPRLRFPEFRNAADWKTRILGSQGSFLPSLTGKAAKDFDTGDAAFIPYKNVFSNAFTNTTDLRSVNVADDESQSAVAKGDVFFTVSSETPEEAGMSSVLLEEIGNCYLNSFCALFRFDEGKSPDPVFLGYLLRSAPAREHLSRGAQGATRYNISRATFRSLPILIPSGPEQKKIADCLRPLDDLIAAEGRNLDSLRQHKRGLIQQLFPSLGGH